PCRPHAADRAARTVAGRGGRGGGPGGPGARARAGAGAGRPGVPVSGLRRRRPRRARLPAAYVPANPGEHELLVVQAQPAVEVVGVDLAQAVVLDPGDEPGRGVQRTQAALGGAEVVLTQRVADR